MPSILKNNTLVVKQDFPVCYKAIVIGIEISQKTTYKNGWDDKHVSGYRSHPDHGVSWSGSSQSENPDFGDSEGISSSSSNSSSSSISDSVNYSDGIFGSRSFTDKNVVSSETHCYQHKLLEVYFKSKDDAIEFIKTKDYGERCYALIIPIYEGTEERHLKPEEVSCFTWKWNKEKQTSEIKDFVISQEPASFASDMRMLKSYLHIVPISKPLGWS